MTETKEETFVLPDQVGTREIMEQGPDTGPSSPPESVPLEQSPQWQEMSSPAPEAEHHNGTAIEEPRWHVEAGRKGANRVHQLIKEGKLYEQEHGLKRGRQRQRQLIELGKLYEQEHGLRPATPKKGRTRLHASEREELLGTLLRCLVRIAKPSFREELVHLVEGLQKKDNGQTV